MVDLLPGVSAQHALELLSAATVDGQNVRNTTAPGVELLNAYRAWAVRQARVLASGFPSREIDALLLTSGYARLLQLDPRTYGNGVAEPVSLELDIALSRLEDAREQLQRRRSDWQVWRRHLGDHTLSAVMVDTNVLLRHCERIDALNWHEPLELWPHDPVALAVPLVVVEELDGLKRATHKMDVDGVEVHVKQLARAALKHLDQWFIAGSTRHVLHERTAQDLNRGELSIQLVLDDLQHIRLPSADAEIIDRALALRPFTRELAIATNDRAMRFRAQHAGVLAFDPQVLDAPATQE